MEDRYLGQLVWVGLAGPVLTPEEEAFLKDVQPGGIVLFSRNVESVDQLQELLRSVCARVSDPPPWIAVDEEGGWVQRLKGVMPRLPSAAWLGARPDFPHYEYHRLVATCLYHLGVRVNLGPVVDLGLSGSWIQTVGRCFSDNPRDVVRRTRPMVAAYADVGMALCLKHFPGLGRARQDTHLEWATVDASAAELESSDLIPFRRLAREVPMVMVSHAEYPAWAPGLPASLAAPVYTILRRRWRYAGVILTDDLHMDAVARRWSPIEAGRLALRAGADGLLFCQGIRTADLALAEIRAAMVHGAAWRLGYRFRRILRWKARYLREPVAVDRTAFDRARERLCTLLRQNGWWESEGS